MDRKVKIRKIFKKKRKELGAEERLVLDKKILANLDEALGDVVKIGIFYPLEDEINLLGLPDKDREILIPKIQKDKSLKFYSINEELVKHEKYGIMEPIGTTEIIPEVIICPLLAFDQNKHRLGYGGGYYDRTLAKFPNTKTIGVAYHFQQTGQLPTEPTDQSLNLIITNKTTIY